MEPTTDIGTFITQRHGVYGGHPCISGTRYPVSQVAIHFNSGRTAEVIAAEYGLELSHVYAAIAYYLANKQILDRELEQTQTENEAALQKALKAAKRTA